MVEWSLSSVLDIGSVSTDSEDLALQKRMLVGSSGLVTVAGAIWATVYLLLGEGLAASIPGSYALLTAINIGVFAVTKRYRWFRATQLVFFLVLAVGIASHYVPERWYEAARERFATLPAPAQGVALFGAALVVRKMATADAVPFVYFQF